MMALDRFVRTRRGTAGTVPGIGLALALAWIPTSQSHASPASTATLAGNTKPQLLLLGFYSAAGTLDSGMRDQVATGLGSKGRYVIHRPELPESATGLGCLDEKCFSELLRKYPWVDQIIGGGVFFEGGGIAEVQSFIYAAKDRTGPDGKTPERLLQLSEPCRNCDGVSARQHLVDAIAIKLDRLYPVPVLPPPPPRGGSQSVCTKSDFLQGLAMGGGGSALLSGVVAVTTISLLRSQSFKEQGVTVYNEDGSVRWRAHEMADPWQRYTAPGGIAISLGALSLGAGLASNLLKVKWASVAESCPDKKLTRDRGIAFGTFIGLLAGSLPATIAAFASHNRPCHERLSIEDPTQTSQVRCEMLISGAAAAALSTAWAVGAALSYPW